MKLIAPFIRLPYRYDTDILYREISQVPRSEWQAHPGKHKGNYAIPLISVDGEINDKFAGRMKPTRYLETMPYTAQVIASFGEVVSRSRIMIIEGGGALPMHCDINYHWYSRVRIHIPVVTNSRVEFTCAGHKAHMPAGEAWLLDTWNSHQVRNDSGETRIHLVVDTAGSAKFWELVDAAERPTEGPAQPGQAPRFVAYEPGKAVNIVTEQFNVPVVMSPGEVDGLTSDIVNDLKQHPGNNPEAVRRFGKIVDHFRQDWRQVYGVHGPSRSGWTYYEQLVDGAVQSVQTMNADLLLASNSANAANTLCARVLWPAFNREMAKYYPAAMQAG